MSLLNKTSIKYILGFIGVLVFSVVVVGIVGQITEREEVRAGTVGE